MPTQAKLVQKSKYNGFKIYTFDVEFPRIILAELTRHRSFSFSVSSSRAIPNNKMIEQTLNDPYEPKEWLRNQAGMTAMNEQVDDVAEVSDIWFDALDFNTNAAKQLYNGGKGVHKQFCNRLIEPFQYIKAYITTTDIENFYWLRIHPDAQPEIRELAQAMYDAEKEADYTILYNGEWHLPFVNTNMYYGQQAYFDYDGEQIAIDEALMLNASIAAQQSYRKADTSMEKARKIYEKLFAGNPIHASPAEHAAKAYTGTDYAARISMMKNQKYMYDISGAYTEEQVNKLVERVMYTGPYNGFAAHRFFLENENLTKKFKIQ